MTVAIIAIRLNGIIISDGAILYHINIGDDMSKVSKIKSKMTDRMIEILIQNNPTIAKLVEYGGYDNIEEIIWKMPESFILKSLPEAERKFYTIN